MPDHVELIFAERRAAEADAAAERARRERVSYAALGWSTDELGPRNGPRYSSPTAIPSDEARRRGRCVMSSC
jgi:hypothetical protein